MSTDQASSESGYPSITVRQPGATLLALNIKRMVSSRQKAPAALIRQHVRIHAGTALTRHLAVGDWHVAHDRTATAGSMWRVVGNHTESVTLPLGAIVATARLLDCVPILGAGATQEIQHGGRFVRHSHTDKPGLFLSVREDFDGPGGDLRDLSDQLPYDDFRPGNWVWVFDDIRPTTERCPDCMGDGMFFEDSMIVIGVPGGRYPAAPCDTCNQEGKCPPVPAKVRRGVWKWSPWATPDDVEHSASAPR